MKEERQKSLTEGDKREMKSGKRLLKRRISISAPVRIINLEER